MLRPVDYVETKYLFFCHWKVFKFKSVQSRLGVKPALLSAPWGGEAELHLRRIVGGAQDVHSDIIKSKESRSNQICIFKSLDLTLILLVMGYINIT